MSKVLHIIHFNDVYNVDERQQEPVGGAARFVEAVKSFQHLDPLILFSGDAFSPSILSNVTKGAQMIPVLNELGIKYSVIGNHDFDFGVDLLDQRLKETNFTWLMSNAIDSTTCSPLGNGKVSDIFEWNGVKIGIMGLVEKEWIDTLSTLDPEDVVVLDFADEGQKIAEELINDGAELVIALTHMRWPNDILLAEKVPEIDLILGGHDHDYNCVKVNNNYVIKSGTDFRQFSHITITINYDFLICDNHLIASIHNGPNDLNSDMQTDGDKMLNKSEKLSLKFDMIEVNSSFKENEKIRDLVKEYTKELDSQLDIVIGQLDVDLDGQFTSIRRQETNLGNFITDIMLKATDAEIALLNSGTLRSDMIHTKGDFKMKDLNSMLPMLDNLVVLKLTGRQFLESLENSVSKYPALEGRFAQISGAEFAFDPIKTPGHRVDSRLVRVQGHPLRLDDVYKLVTKAYISEGKDGYDVFKNTEKLNIADDGVVLSTAVINHFQSIKIIKGEVKSKFVHRQSIIPIFRKLSITASLFGANFENMNYNLNKIDENIDGRESENKISMQSTLECLANISTNSAFESNNSSVNASKASTPVRLHKQNEVSDPDFDLDNSLKKQHEICRRQSLMQTRTMSFSRHHSISIAENQEFSSILAPQVEGRILIVNDKNRQSLLETFSQHLLFQAIKEEPSNNSTNN